MRIEKSVPEIAKEKELIFASDDLSRGMVYSFEKRATFPEIAIVTEALKSHFRKNGIQCNSMVSVDFSHGGMVSMRIIPEGDYPEDLRVATRSTAVDALKRDLVPA